MQITETTSILFLIVFLKAIFEPRGEIGAKPTKVTLFIMILYNLENSIRDTRSFCRPLFCHSSVV